MCFAGQYLRPQYLRPKRLRPQYLTPQYLRPQPNTTVPKTTVPKTKDHSFEDQFLNVFRLSEGVELRPCYRVELITE